VLVAWHVSWGDIAGEVPAVVDATDPLPALPRVNVAPQRIVRPKNVATTAAPPPAPPPGIPPPPPAPAPAPPPIPPPALVTMLPATPAPPGQPIPPPPAAPVKRARKPKAAPATPAGPGEDQLRDRALGRVAAGKWKAARDALEADFDRMGMTRMVNGQVSLASQLGAPPQKLKRAVKIRRINGAYGLHNSYTGDIALDTGVAARAQQLATDWAADPALVRRRLARAAELAGQTPPPPWSSTPWPAEDMEALRTAERLKSTRTILHETYHGYGPRLARATTTQGAGLLTEEMTTEFAARNWVRTRMGVPAELMDRGAGAVGSGGYPGWCAKLIDAVQLESGLPRQQAIEAIEAAAIKYKKLPGDTVTSPAQAADTFAGLLPGAAARNRHHLGIIAGIRDHHDESPYP
jgi:hypothetical protein